MDTELLERKFARIGARVSLRIAPRPRYDGDRGGTVQLDIENDRDGEFFVINLPQETVRKAEVQILDVKPAERHLLVLVREGEGLGEKHKFLCGHDERHWFVAAVPESAPVGTVRAAMDALKPDVVQDAVARSGLGLKARNRRRNAAFRRQGEWFFLPVPTMKVDPKLILRNEPIRRGNGGKPHWVDEIYRTGGESVLVCDRYPNGLTSSEHVKLVEQTPEVAHLVWRWIKHDAFVHARGRIRHADHRTITLHCWHRVLMNTETQAVAMRNVSFLD